MLPWKQKSASWMRSLLTWERTNNKQSSPRSKTWPAQNGKRQCNLEVPMHYFSKQRRAWPRLSSKCRKDCLQSQRVPDTLPSFHIMFANVTS
eukprot:12221760-Prorocentrum_lima.AAC.1